MSAGSALIRKDWYALLNLRRLAREQSRFKIAFVLLFGVGFTAGIWALFVEGFAFLDTLGGASSIIISRLFSLFFFGLGCMLVLSGAVTSYATLFRSEETAFLLTRPFSVGLIVIYKFLEASLLSSWAFFLVVVPFVGAYAWHQHLTLWFPVWALLFCLPYLLLCSGVGTLGTLLLVRWLPRRRRWVVLLAGATGLAAVVLWLVVRSTTGFGPDTTFILARMIPGFMLAANPLLPSWWVAEGIMALVRAQWLRGGLLLGVLIANMLFAGLLIERIGSLVFYVAWQKVMGAAGRRQRRPVLLSGVRRALSFVGRDVRAILLKDMRVFLRDPAQWSQVLVFFGLLGLYFVNLRSFRYHTLPDDWRNLIAFLNIFSVSAVLCSLSSRFVYPQLSLEGQGFWLIGLAPTTPSRVLLAKFGLAAAGMAGISTGLMWLSTLMLKMEPAVKLTAIGLALAISLATSGLSVGLGAAFLDLKQRNPAAIVSGFGGTLNLVLSLGFMLAAVLPFAGVYHLYFQARLGLPEAHRWLLLCTAWLVTLTVLTTALPLAAGRRSLSRHEF